MRPNQNHTESRPENSGGAGRSLGMANQPPAPRQPAVQEELGILRSNIGDLSYVVGELEDRLMPVVVPPEPPMTAPNGTTHPVPLVASLEDLNAQVNTIAARVRSLRDRVEV